MKPSLDVPQRAQVRLLHPKVRVVLPSGTVVNDLRSRQKLLRLLILSEGHQFSTEELASIFGFTNPKSVAPMVSDLRSMLDGPDWGKYAIHGERGTGYCLLSSTVTVDAFEFREMLRGLSGLQHRELSDPEDLSPEEAEQALAVLEPALHLWRDNPAKGLESITYSEHMYHTEFEAHHEVALRLKLLSQLRLGTISSLRDAALALERATSPEQDPDIEQWCLRMRAHHSLGQHQKVIQIYNVAVRYYRETLRRASIPPAITRCFERAQSGDADFSLLRDAGARQIVINPETAKLDLASHVPADFEPSIEQLLEFASTLDSVVGAEGRALVALLRELLQLVSTIGISTASVLRLQGSHVEPKQCLRRVTSQLWFTGVLASKWVETPAIRSAFDDLLTVLDDAPGADVRFMIMNPDGPGYKRLYDLRNGKLSAEHVPFLAQMVEDHSSFQVRTFDNLPTFRILVIDRDFVTFSFYRLEEQWYVQSDGGLESPHVVLDPQAPWPLAEAFRGVFEEAWRAGTDLDLARFT